MYAVQESGNALTNTRVWPIWRVYPKLEMSRRTGAPPPPPF